MSVLLIALQKQRAELHHSMRLLQDWNPPAPTLLLEMAPRYERLTGPQPYLGSLEPLGMA